jgi:hypothetical protein
MDSFFFNTIKKRLLAEKFYVKENYCEEEEFLTFIIHTLYKTYYRVIISRVPVAFEIVDKLHSKYDQSVPVSEVVLLA